MPNNTTAATVVGNKFVLEYYTALSQHTDSVATYYKAESSLTFSVGSFDVTTSYDAETEMLFGVANIQKKIKSLNFHGCKVAVSSINCQESLNGGIVVVALGTIAIRHENHFQTPRPFIQTFFLGIQSEPLLSYYVLNDIFQFINVPVNASSNQHAKTVIPAPVPTSTSYTVASVSKQPETVNVAHSNVSAVPEVHHSPIPAPQTTVLPVVHDKQHQDHAHHQTVNHVQTTTAPKSETTHAKTENTNASQGQSKPASNGKPKVQQRSDSQRSNDEFKTVGSKKGQDNRESRSPRTKRDPQDKDGQQKPKGTKSGNNTRKDKKAENQTPESTEHSTHQPSSQNSWARIAKPSASEQAVVFAPPSIVYTAPPEEKREDKKEKKEKKDDKADKPKKEGKPKKEDPEKAAWKKTRDMRSVRIDNLPFSADEAQVRDLFTQFGPINEVSVRKGFAYVEFQTVTGVTNVLNHTKKASLFMDALNKEGKKGGARELTVEQRKPRPSAEPEKPFFKDEALKLKAEQEKAEKAEKAQQEQQAQVTVTN